MIPFAAFHKKINFFTQIIYAFNSLFIKYIYDALEICINNMYKFPQVGLQPAVIVIIRAHHNCTRMASTIHGPFTKHDYRGAATYVLTCIDVCVGLYALIPIYLGKTLLKINFLV